MSYQLQDFVRVSNKCMLMHYSIQINAFLMSLHTEASQHVLCLLHGEVQTVCFTSLSDTEAPSTFMTSTRLV